MFQRYRLSGILLLVYALNCYSVSEAKTLTFVSEGWCPYACDPVKDKHLGYLVDIIHAVFEKQGYQINYQIIPYKRAIDFTRKGKVNAVVGIYQGDAPDLLFPPVAQGISINSFFVKQDSPWQYTGVHSLKGISSIGIMQGYDYGDLEFQDYIQDNPDKVKTMTGADMLARSLKSVIHGRVNILLEDINVIRHNLQKLNSPPSSVKKAGLLGSPNPVYIAFAPTVEHSQHYVHMLVSGVEQLRISGQLKKILDKYSLDDWHTPEPDSQ